MKVLFSNPPWWVRAGQGWRQGIRAGSRWPFTMPTRTGPDQPAGVSYLPYPLFLAHATSYAQQHTAAQVVYRDSIALREGYGTYLRHLGDGYDAVLIESASPAWEHDAALLRVIGEEYPRLRRIVAGPIAITRAAEILESGLADTVLVGEYEKPCVRALGGETGVIGPDFLGNAEMDALPPPYLDEVYAGRYWDGNPAGQVFPHLQIWTSRGCAYRCLFCVWPATMTGHDPDGHGKRLVRQHSAEWLEDTLTRMVCRFGFKTIYFDDDTFNLGDRHVLAVCGVMRRLGLPWAAMCRADTCSRDAWRQMRESGCVGVKIGFESGCQQVVDALGKRLDLDAARDTVQFLKALGLTVHGTFTYGLPGETPEQMRQTRAYRESLGLDTYQESGAAEIEGTPLHSLRAQGRLSGAVESDGVAKMERLAGVLG